MALLLSYFGKGLALLGHYWGKHGHYFVNTWTLLAQYLCASTESQEVTEVIVDPERGTREKKYKDGRLEVWYSNGNRKEVSSDGQTVKVSPASVMVASHHQHH